jgi:hypothetical protein
MPIAREKDVRGFEIAVDDSAIVGGRHPVRDLHRHLHGLAHGQGAGL